MEIAIISGKGGTGKSSIAASFVALAERCVAVDCDVDASNLYLLLQPTKEEERVFISGHHAVLDPERCKMCGACLYFCKFDAIRMGDTGIWIDETACEGCHVCSRICTARAIEMIPSDKSRLYTGSFRGGKMVYGRLAPGEENSGKLIHDLRVRAKEIGRENALETLILDGPPGISCPVISTVTGVDKVVLVTEPTLSGVSDARRAVEMVRKFGMPLYMIINKFDLNPEITAQLEAWCQQEGIPVVGLFPFDPEVLTAMIDGKSIVEHRPESEISVRIGEAFQRIMKDGSSPVSMP